jgi:DNA-binding MarR family transcriptional regulator
LTFHLFTAWPQEARDFTVAIERAARLIRAARRGIAGGADLTLANRRLLALIHRAPARSPARLARRLRVSRQAVHAMAQRLRSAGYLAIAQGPGNRKSVQLTLTPRGGLLLANLEETLVTVLLEVANDIPRDALVGTAARLNRFSARLRRCEALLRRQRQT